MRLPMRFYGDPVLREKTQPVGEVTEELLRLAADMVETMHEESGVGLAAPQIGRTESLCVVEVPADVDVDEEGNRLHPDIDMPMILINPEITAFSDDQESMEEGCLSFPGIGGQIRRPLAIALSYTTPEGGRVEHSLTGFLSRVVQHEVDHLNGVLFIDRMSPVRKVALSGRLKRMSRETEAALGLA